MATELSPPPVDASAELSSRDWQRRCQAVLALARRLRGRPDDAPALEARLLALALDPQWQVREEVAVALELAEHPDTDGALKALAGDGASAVARAAKRALRERRRLARAAARRGERVAGVLRRLRRLERRASPELAREVEELSRAYHQEVAFGCSHDVLNLVHAIQHGLRELSGELERRRVPKKVWQETLERADRRSQIVKGIAESMRAFAKQQVPAVRRVGLRRAVEEALDVVADRYAATGGASAVRAIVRVPTHLRVEVPRDRLLQALINLLQNAYEAIRGDGVVWVEAELRATQVVLYLADTGCGIRPEDQALVFFPGKSTKKGRRESEHNTGWGLSLARKFVEEDCRGELTLDSQRGEGTTVTLTLPLRRPEEDA